MNTMILILWPKDTVASSNTCEEIPLDLGSISFPTVAKFSALETSDMLKLQEVYLHLYNTAQPHGRDMLRTIKIYKTITYYNQHSEIPAQAILHTLWQIGLMKMDA